MAVLFGAVMPYGGNFLAVGGFLFFCGAVTTSAEAVKPKYGGNFSAVGSFSFLAVTTLVEAVKPKYGGKSAYYRFRRPGR